MATGYTNTGYDPTQKSVPIGYVEIAAWSGSTPGTNFVNIGDVEDVTCDQKVSTIETVTYDNGIETADNIIPSKLEYTLKIKCTQLSYNNLAIFVQSTMSGSTLKPFSALVQYYTVRFTPSGTQLGYPNIETYHKVLLTGDGARALFSPKKPAELNFIGRGMIDKTNNPDNPYFSMVQPTL